jgi:hypothetical protein
MGELRAKTEADTCSNLRDIFLRRRSHDLLSSAAAHRVHCVAARAHSALIPFGTPNLDRTGLMHGSSVVAMLKTCCERNGIFRLAPRKRTSAIGAANRKVSSGSDWVLSA